MSTEAPAEPIPSRRQWLRRGAGAGIAGIVVLATGRPAAATTPPSEPPTTPPSQTPASDERSSTSDLPNGAPTAADADALRYMLGVELATRDLYVLASDAGAATVAPDLITVLAKDHDAYSEALGAMLGTSTSDSLDADFFGERRATFDTSDVPALAEAAYRLESELVATHIELLGVLRNVDAAELLASILITEARHCAILADLAGRGNDLVALLENSAEPLPHGIDTEAGR